MWRIRRFIESISNLIYYFDVVWNDRDWDHEYIHCILLKKLKKTLKRYSESEYVMNQEKEITQPLRICVEILEREDKGFYYNNPDFLNRDKDGNTYIHLCEERDNTILYSLLGTYVRYWWD